METLRDKGYRFCISPNKQRGRWISPIEHEKTYPDWTDHTDTHDEEFYEFLQSPVDTEAQ